MLLYLYMFLYNLTMLGIFWIIKSILSINFKTLYSFNIFSFDSFYLFFLTIFLFSLAGVPPFIGFFNKLFLLNLLVEYSFYLLYFLLFVILIVGLYFYMQNLRFLHSTNYHDHFKPFLVNDKSILGLNYFLVLQALVLINGVFILDELFPVFFWILL